MSGVDPAQVSLLSQVSSITVMSATFQLSRLPVSLAISKSVLPSPSHSPFSLSDWSEILFFLPVSKRPPSLFTLVSVRRLSV